MLGALLMVLLASAPRANAGPALPKPAPHPPATPGLFPPAPFEAPYHGSLDAIAIGGHGELRFAEDREDGASNPEWFSVGRVNGFVFARLHPRLRVAAQACWDRAADDFVFERAEILVRVSHSVQAHAGIFLAPLGRTNLSHDTPPYDFAERSLVATQLIGVPNAQVGVGVMGVRGSQLRPSRLSYEVDLVTGYDDGLIMDSPGGTRIPRGRNNYGDNNGMPAIVWRVAHGSPGKEIGLAAQSGQYNETMLNGVRVDAPRWIHVVVADGTTRIAGCSVSAEAAAALIDVPPGLRDLFSEQQHGASVEVVRTLFEPIVRGWKSSSLTAALRADAVDFDRSVKGDSRSRLSASLNIHSRPLAVTRFGWYYEIRRDRFNNKTPLGGVTLTAATYF